MELTNSEWQIGVVALIIGAMIGAIAYRMLAPKAKEAARYKGELDALRKEQSEYKAGVDRHFDKTSELVNDLTQNYVRVYQHLAEGAQTLGDGRSFNNLLEQHQGKVSIAVEDKTESEAKVVEDTNAEVTSAGTVEMVEEYSKTSNDVSVDVPELHGEEADAVEGKVSKLSNEPDVPAENAEPVINVDALDQTLERADTEDRADEKRAMPEVEEKDEVRTTTH